MNTPGSISPGRTPGSSPSWWHLSTWSDYLSRITRPAKQAPVRMTRRQELLAAQERKRQEQRAHVLELLNEVKQKHQPAVQDTHKLKA